MLTDLLLTESEAGFLNDAFMFASTALSKTHVCGIDEEKQLACTIIVLYCVERLYRPKRQIRIERLAEMGLEHLLALNNIPMLPLNRFD